MCPHTLADRLDVAVLHVLGVRKAGICSDNASKTIGRLGGVAKPYQTTPVLADQGDISKP